jgi:hypothetical protein
MPGGAVDGRGRSCQRLITTSVPCTDVNACHAAVGSADDAHTKSEEASIAVDSLQAARPSPPKRKGPLT